MRSTALAFRLATIEDLNILNDLARRSKGYWGYDAAFMDAFMKKFAVRPQSLTDGIYVLMNLGPELVGFYGFALQDPKELDYFFIEPAFIGKGFGRMMWSHAIQTAKSHNWDQFVLWSDPGADAFYMKMGCEKIGQRPSPLALNRFPTIFKYAVFS